MFTFTYNNQSPEDFGAYVIRRPSIPAPQLRGDWIAISGRDGSFLDTDGTYENLQIDIELNFIRQRADQYPARSRELKRWLISDDSQRLLYFSDDADMGYRVKQASLPEIERVARRGGRATASFVCDPYTYYIEGLNRMSASAARQNPGTVNAWPVLYIDATNAGTINFTVNGGIFTFPVTAGETYLDTEKKIVVGSDGSVINGQTTGDFADLVLVPGANTISVTGSSGLTFTAEIEPRWRTL